MRAATANHSEVYAWSQPYNRSVIEFLLLQRNKKKKETPTNKKSTKPLPLVAQSALSEVSCWGLEGAAMLMLAGMFVLRVYALAGRKLCHNFVPPQSPDEGDDGSVAGDSQGLTWLLISAWVLQILREKNPVNLTGRRDRTDPNCIHHDVWRTTVDLIRTVKGWQDGIND